MAKELLFIHKDLRSTSLSCSDSQERRKIQRHVQSGRFRTKKTGFEPKLERAFCASRTRKRSQQPRFASAQRTCITICKNNVPNFLPAPPTATQSSLSNGNRRRTCPGHQTINPPPIQNNSTDPFSATITRIEASYHTLLQYFVQVAHPRTWHAELTTQGSYIFEHSASDIVANCVASPMSMYTMLASMASQIQYFEGLPALLDTAMLIHKALIAFKEHIEMHPIDTKVIFGIHSLANAEFYRFNVQAARTHVCAVKTFVDQAGGLEILPQYLKEWFVAGDEFIAAETNQKPLFAASEIDPGQWSYTRKSSVNAPVYPMLENEEWKDIPISLKCIVADIREYMDLVLAPTYVVPSSTKQSTFILGHWLHLRACSIRNRLLTLQIEGSPYEAMRLAILAWCYMTKTVTGRRRTMQVIASRLRSVLSNAQWRWDAHKSHMWIITVGALASENSNIDRSWFILELIKLADSNGVYQQRLSSEEALAQILKEFLYFEPVQLSMVRSLAIEMNKGQ